jgi:hypothetical protein
MSTREHRRFIKEQILESERLGGLVKDHPIMGPLMLQREQRFRAELHELPPAGPEPRTVLFFSGDPVVGSRGIDAQFASAVMSPFLEMVKTEYAAEKHGHVGARGRRKDEDEARLLLTGLPRGSFGLELSQPFADDLFASEHLSGVLVRLADLFSAAAKSDEDFVIALEDVSPRVYTRLTDFFKALSTHGASLRMQTGDLEVVLEKEKIPQALERVSSAHEDNERIERRGVFRGATLDTWKFDFRDESGTIINGDLGAELSEEKVAEMLTLTNQTCTAILNEQRISARGTKAKPRYQLLDLATHDNLSRPRRKVK